MQNVNMEEIQNKYKTKDLAEASFLLANGKSLLLVEKEGKTCWFIFPDFQECQQLVNSFWFGNASINAKNFYDAIQMLKSKIFASI